MGALIRNHFVARVWRMSRRQQANPCTSYGANPHKSQDCDKHSHEPFFHRHLSFPFASYMNQKHTARMCNTPPRAYSLQLPFFLTSHPIRHLADRTANFPQQIVVVTPRELI